MARVSSSLPTAYCLVPTAGSFVAFSPAPIWKLASFVAVQMLPGDRWPEFRLHCLLPTAGSFVVFSPTPFWQFGFVRCSSNAPRRSLARVSSSLPTAYCLLPTTGSFVAFSPAPIWKLASFVAVQMSPGDRWPEFRLHCLLPTAYCLLPTTGLFVAFSPAPIWKLASFVAVQMSPGDRWPEFRLHCLLPTAYCLLLVGFVRRDSEWRCLLYQTAKSIQQSPVASFGAFWRVFN